MGSDAGKRIGATGRGDLWKVPPEVLYSPRSDPKHPEHANWLVRVNPETPETAALISAMREHGTDEGEPIIVYTDGDRTCVADGDRRMAACAFVNRERKAKRQPPLTLRAVTTRDPIVARALGNAARLDDPPMILARRYREAAEAMGDAAAAAVVGLTLAHANALRECLKAPADVQAKVNAREMPADVAARTLKKGGSGAVAEVVAKSSDSDGKVNGKAARKAAREVTGARAKSLPAHVIAKVEKQIAPLSVRAENGYDFDIAAMVLAAFALARGDYKPALAIPDLRAALLRAGYDEERGRLPTGPNKRTGGKAAES